ncbi:MAG: M20/M25/M40 family metallo-hydrolase [Nitrospirota bacterium]
MARTLIASLVLLAAALPAQTSGASRRPALLHHELRVTLLPEEQSLTAEDTITVPEGFGGSFHFVLHRGLDPRPLSGDVDIEEGPAPPGMVPLASYRVTLPAGRRSLSIRYGGRIYHPLEAVGKEQARGFKASSGMISPDGVFLGGSSAWYPLVGEGQLQTFALQVETPGDWEAVSQGRRTFEERVLGMNRVRWVAEKPQEEIYLVAGPWTKYSREEGRVRAMVYLREPDRELASRYLEATGRYVAMYEKLIGPYPYGKFALVENFWETGYGMPSFTLMGPTVIRLPFIVRTSYPHEILHNWWGNGVYVDYASGNWSEGLTAYLSDHLLKEQRGQGDEYRREALQKYADYVKGRKDFPLSEFLSRHSTATEAVGYGKSLMLFHMLRRTLGDGAFVEGLRDFYRENVFTAASWDDLRKSFEKVSGRDLRGYFDQWVRRTGAPDLMVLGARARRGEEGYLLEVRLKQAQPGESYSLRVPVAVTAEGQETAGVHVLSMKEKEETFTIPLASRPLRVDVDPACDVFRKLHAGETPPAITGALGSEKMLIVLPSRAGPDLRAAYQMLGRALSASGPEQAETVTDAEITQLPGDRAVALLGWENRFLPVLTSSLSRHEVAIGQKSASIAGEEFRLEDHTFVLAGRLADGKERALLWVATDRPQALAGLGRKLPHYHKYSYLVFSGDQPAIIFKGRWAVKDSPMTVFLTNEHIPMGRTPPPEPLIGPPEQANLSQASLSQASPSGTAPEPGPSRAFSKERMMRTVRFLSSGELEGRGLGEPGLTKAAEFIAGEFHKAGLVPAGGADGYFQQWEETVSGKTTRLRNVIGAIPGANPAYEGQSVILGAHYDGLGRSGPATGKIHPGADDDASGVAILLELARVLSHGPGPERTVLFVAFTGEESGRRGSEHFVRTYGLYPPGKAAAMINLDTVGRLEAGKLIVLGTGTATEWEHIFRGAGYEAHTDVEAVSRDPGSGDQVSFQAAGIPAVQLFTGAHLDYHRPTDTWEKLDPEGLLAVARVTGEAVAYLASREAPLTWTGGGEVPGASRNGHPVRTVRLGTVPDYAYQGRGVRLAGVVPGSPAQSIGLREGDVLTGVNGQEVSSLRDLARVLSSLSPGERVSVVFSRKGEVITRETLLTRR